MTLGFPDHRAVYRRLDRITSSLKVHLLAEGISGKDVAEILGWKDLDAEILWGEDS